MAERLLGNARDEDTVCRHGGDEFLYLLINPSGRQVVAQTAERVRQSISAPISLGELQLVVTPSIGIALYPEHDPSGQHLIAQADAAMVRAKARASPFEFFEPEATAAVPTAAATGPAA